MAGLKTAIKEVLKDPEALARRAAEWLNGLAVESTGVFRVCLSGGSTPKRMYEILASMHAETFPWNRVHWFWGDERYVAADDEKSNFHMANQAMLAKAPIPRTNIHRVLTESETPEIAATRYQANLQQAYGGQVLDPARPLFDVMLLGLGEDAHTASLFPGNKALKVTNKWVVAVPDGTPPPRITLTFPAINSSRHAAVLVAGQGKVEPLKRVWNGDMSAPASHVAPVGKLYLFVDEAVASACK